VRIVDRLDAGDRAQVGGGLVDVGCCRAPEGDASTERIGRCRATPHSAEIPDGAARLAELRLRAVRRAARQRRGRRRARSPTRACSRSRRRPRGRGAMRARTAGTATGSGRSRRPCATRREGRSPRSSPAATRQVRRPRKRIGQRHVLGRRPAIRGAPGGRDYPQALMRVASGPDCSGSQRTKDEVKFGDVARRLPARRRPPASSGRTACGRHRSRRTAPMPARWRYVPSRRTST
jgi:hypothetical protein